MMSLQNTTIGEDFKCVSVILPNDKRYQMQLLSLDRHKIASKYENLMNTGLKKWDGMGDEEHQLLKKIRAVFENGVTRENYARFFKYHLWLEEAAALIGLKNYTMFKVKLTLKNKNYIELEVPGLGEKRPSICLGDIITVRSHVYHIGYQGIVHTINDKSILINKFDNIFILMMRQGGNHLLWDVKFELSRMQIIRRHDGVKFMTSGKLNRIFPEKPTKEIIKKVIITSTDLINNTINKEQLKAVDSIVNCTSQHAPYIVFGPPGTGKTVTIVEAILQTLIIYPEKRILVCAPSNSACDNIAAKLVKYCKEEDNQLLRLHTTTRDPSLIPREILKCSSPVGRGCRSMSNILVKQYKIVVTTLGMIGKYRDLNPNILFIDEAAQATEPECDVAISLMGPESFIVLAGDPQQLGPVCQSHTAEVKGLGQSLMERLMFKNDLYKETLLKFDEDYITMLVRNYRSNSSILEIPNNYFYKNKLIISGSIDDISKISISKIVHNLDPSGIDGKAVEFYGLLSMEERNGSSPSYYNNMEIEMVIKYVKALLELQEYDVEEQDIGIITPYIRQVSKIKEALVSLRLKDINVGTAEAYQGSEKRIIIISTVRAQEILLEYDQKFQLGFVSNKRRFNVALTRAKSKLIIIGNPHVLATNEHWLAYMNLCRDLKSYFGVDIRKASVNSIVDEMSKINISKHR